VTIPTYSDISLLQASDGGSLPYAKITIEGRILDPRRLTTSMSVARYLDVAIKPSDWLDPSKAAPSDKRFIFEHMENHQKTQRKLSGAKARNVDSLVEYIVEDILIVERGMLPQFILWTDQPSRVVDSVQREGYAAVGILEVSQRLMVLDGETRTEALSRLAYGADRERLDDDQIRMLMSLNLDVCLLHGISQEQAAKVFVDINHRGVRVNAALAMTMDVRDPLSRLATKAAEKLNLRLSSGRQSGGASETDITMLRLRQMALAFIMGTNKAVQIGTRVLPVRDISIEMPDGQSWAPLVKAEDEMRTVEAFSGWLSDLLGIRGDTRGLIGTWADINDPSKAVSSGPVLIALAGVGQCRLLGDVTAEQNVKRALSNEIAWTINPRWDGLAGDVKPDGHGGWKVASASPKQTGTMVNAALADETSIYWTNLRRELTEADHTTARVGHLARLQSELSAAESQQQKLDEKLAADARAGKNSPASQRRKRDDLAARIHNLRKELDSLGE
jgi:hypothetical protein